MESGQSLSDDCMYISSLKLYMKHLVKSWQRKRSMLDVPNISNLFKFNPGYVHITARGNPVAGEIFPLRPVPSVEQCLAFALTTSKSYMTYTQARIIYYLLFPDCYLSKIEEKHGTDNDKMYSRHRHETPTDNITGICHF